jgi:transcriptional regulator with XRE-family HTH domain
MSKATKIKLLKFDADLLGADILKKRIKDNLSLRDAGEQVGLNYARLQTIEAAKHNVAIDTFLRIVTWLKTEPQKYFSTKLVNK